MVTSGTAVTTAVATIAVSSSESGDIDINFISGKTDALTRVCKDVVTKITLFFENADGVKSETTPVKCPTARRQLQQCVARGFVK